MKQLLIIRHAKSSWADPGQEDFDRPLNKRGEEDAPKMAKRVLDRKVKIDAFISSTAKRAFTTATYFAETFGQKKKEIIGLQQLYHAYPAVYYDVISRLSDDLDTVAIFAHNPGITLFVNELTLTRVDNMPTCAVFAIQVQTEHWKDFEKAEKKFWFFDYPKL